MVKVEFYEPGCGPMFRKHPGDAAREVIVSAVTSQIETQIATHFAKTKLASRRPFRGMKVYECRVNPPKLPALRVAFTVHGDTATAVYLSSHIQKSDFSREIDSFLK